MLLVCMLPLWQKPEGSFMAPTYPMGGSDSSLTRQGGTLMSVLFTLMKLASVGPGLLEKKIAFFKEKSAMRSVVTDPSIHLYQPLLYLFRDFSHPTVQPIE